MLATVLTFSPTILPSASKPMRALVTWSRAWASVMKASERSDVHLTERPVFIDAHRQVISSG